MSTTGSKNEGEHTAKYMDEYELKSGCANEWSVWSCIVVGAETGLVRLGIPDLHPQVHTISSPTS
jgi:hypothetical protein